MPATGPRPHRRPVRIAAAIVVLGVALNVGSLGHGLALDDRIYTSLIAAQLEGRWQVPWHEVASMMNPRGAPGIAALVDEGRLPWWSDPGLRWALFRPLAVLAHYLDMALWPGQPWLMHLQNLAWYAGLLAALWWLYRRTLGAGPAGLLALACFAFSAGHGQVVAWLASRNSMMFVLWSVLALAAHDRGRRAATSDPTTTSAARAPVSAAAAQWSTAALLLLGLLCSEGAVAAWGYLLAHALWLDRAPIRARLVALLPAALTTGAWHLAYRGLGFGTANGGVYLDPVAEPLAFAAAVPHRTWTMLRELLGLPMSLELQRPYPDWAASAVAAAVACAITVRVLWPQAGDPRSTAVQRFFVTGALASLLPLCAAHASYRMLLLPAVGTCAAVGGVLAWSWESWRVGRGRAAVGPARLLRPALATCALLLLLLRLPVAAAAVPRVGRTHLALDRALTGHAARLPAFGPDTTVIVVNTPYYLATMFALYLRAGSDPNLTRHAYVLGSHGGDVVVSRAGEHSLRLRPLGGYLMELTGRVARSPRNPFTRGQRFNMGPARVTVEEITADGRPRSVRFDFDDLGDSRLRFVDIHTRGLEFGVEPFTPPPLGAPVLLHPQR